MAERAEAELEALRTEVKLDEMGPAEHDGATVMRLAQCKQGH